MKVASVMIVVFLAAGCGRNQSDQQATQMPPGHEQMIQQQQAANAPDAVAGISWTIPAAWKIEGARQMRAATYSVPPAQGDADPGECAVFFFGSGQGGDINMNIARWVSQFENPSSRNRSAKDVAGMKVEMIQIEGTYLAPSGPMMESQGKKTNYRLLGAIVPAPEGSVFFKFTGPKGTVGGAEADFNAMIASIKKLPQAM